ncbi:MAG: sialidase family protein [Tepidisphaeraceae bacterium]
MRYATVCAALTVLLHACLARADTPHPGDPPGFTQQTVFQSGQGGYLFYRIPSAVVTTKGTVLVFAEGRRTPWGPHADSGEINIVMRRSTDSAKSFDAQQVVWADGSNTCGNPCAVVDETTGTVILLMTHNLGEDSEGQINRGASKGTRTIWVTTSDDDGVSWSKPREITQDVKKPSWTWYATGPGIGIQLKHGAHKGRLVIPCNHVIKDGGDTAGNSHVIYSDDHGKTWQLGGSPSPREFNESQVVELSDGRVMLNMRNAAPKGRKNAPKQRGVAISSDGGVTFDQATRNPALIEPICQGSIARYTWPLDGGKGRILFANPASDAERVAMTVRLSYDDGQTWPIENLVFKGWSAYSCLVPLPDGKIGLLYEAGGRARYERLEFARLSLEWLTAGKDALGPDEVVVRAGAR